MAIMIEQLLMSRIFRRYLEAWTIVLMPWVLLSEKDAVTVVDFGPESRPCQCGAGPQYQPCSSNCLYPYADAPEFGKEGSISDDPYPHCDCTAPPACGSPYCSYSLPTYPPTEEQEDERESADCTSCLQRPITDTAHKDWSTGLPLCEDCYCGMEQTLNPNGTIRADVLFYKPEDDECGPNCDCQNPRAE